MTLSRVRNFPRARNFPTRAQLDHARNLSARNRLRGVTFLRVIFARLPAPPPAEAHAEQPNSIPARKRFRA